MDVLMATHNDTIEWIINPLTNRWLVTGMKRWCMLFKETEWCLVAEAPLCSSSLYA